MCPFHLNFFLLICISISSSPVRSHNSEFEIILGHQILRLFLRHLLIKACNFCLAIFAIVHDSDPYKRTALTVELKTLSFVLVVILLATTL